MKKWIFVGVILLVLFVLMIITKTLMIGAGIIMLAILVALALLIVAAEVFLGELGASLVKSVGIKSFDPFIFVGIPLAMIFGYLVFLLTGTFLDPNGFLYPASIFSTIVFFIGYVEGFKE